jgi:hypothetical protein
MPLQTGVEVHKWEELRFPVPVFQYVATMMVQPDVTTMVQQPDVTTMVQQPDVTTMVQQPCVPVVVSVANAAVLPQEAVIAANQLRAKKPPRPPSSKKKSHANGGD